MVDGYFALYAVAADSLEWVSRELAKTLPLIFIAHDSGYWGPYLLHGNDLERHVKVYFNSDPMWRKGDPEEEQYFKPEFKGHRVLVEVELPSAEVAMVFSCLSAAFPETVEVYREETAAQQSLQADAAAPRGLS